MKEYHAELLLDAKAALGEGAFWDGRVGWLYWVDIFGHTLHVYDPKRGHDRAIPIGQIVTTVVPLKTDPQRVVVAVNDGVGEVDLATGRFQRRATVPTGIDLRCNDGKCDPAGRLWVGTMETNQNRTGRAALYRVGTDWLVEKVIDGLKLSNGIVWTADGRTLYLIDTPTATVWGYDFDLPSGAATNRRPAVTFDMHKEGHPDGMTIDAHGRLWVANWGGRRVTCVDPSSGQRVAVVHVGVKNVSSCAIGQDGRLFITTARRGDENGENDNEPGAGGIWTAKIEEPAGMMGHFGR